MILSICQASDTVAATSTATAVCYCFRGDANQNNWNNFPAQIPHSYQQQRVFSIYLT